MASFYQISPLFWTDPKVTAWNDSERCLALYLLTCEHRNLEGLYRLPYAYISADLGHDKDTIAASMETLIRADFCRYDLEAQVVFLPKALKYRQPTTKKHLDGALNDLRAVPDSYLFTDFQKAAAEFAPALSELLGNPYEWENQDLETTHSNGVVAT